jgi:DNA-binding response OmpR family regulator
MKILVVEDDPSISGPLRDGLAREGFDVEVAATGTDALAAPPSDLVLLDLGLPDLEGSVVCQRLRAATSVPIIVVSARGEEIDRVMLLELGADDYVVKPFGLRELVAGSEPSPVGRPWRTVRLALIWRRLLLAHCASTSEAARSTSAAAPWS